MTKEKRLKADKTALPAAWFPPVPDSSILIIGCTVDDYMASGIARAVEDADARLLNLNVTSLRYDGQAVVCALRVSHRDPSSVARSLERYGYNVLDFEAPDGPGDDTLRRRYDELMHYLSI